MKVGILADDLTSATDGAAPFVSRGHRCTVLTDDRQSVSFGAGVVSINKASRAVSAEIAAERAGRAAQSLAGAEILYSTVDSTIRGHIEAEIIAALRVSGRSLAVFAPAFPGGGRTTESGRQLLRGVPLEETAFGKDPLHPVADSRLRALFPSLSDAEIRSLPLAELRALRPGDLLADGYKLLIADASNQADLNQLVASVADPRSILWCGSPGMAMALADHVGRAIGAAPSLNLFVIGSVNPMSRDQCAELVGKGSVRLVVIDADEASQSPEVAARTAVTQSLGSGSDGDFLLTTSERGTSADPRQISVALGLAARTIIDKHPVSGLFLTGGDTAEAVLGALDIYALELLGEIEPGIPVGRAAGARSLHIITKAGGFGAPDILRTSAGILRGLHLGDKT